MLELTAVLVDNRLVYVIFWFDGAAFEDFNYHLHCKVLLTIDQFLYHFCNLNCFGCCILVLNREAELTVVTFTVAVTAVKLFAKKQKLHFSSTKEWLLAVLEYRVESVQIFFFTCTSRRIVTNYEVVKEASVFIVVVQYTFSWLSVSTRAPALLNVSF